MSTQLPGFVLAGLYKDSLVITEETIEQNKPVKKQEQVTNKTPKQNIVDPAPEKKWFLGDNKKNITILIRDNNAVYINDEWLATLTKLLAACKLNLSDIAIINVKEGLDFLLIKQQLDPQYVLMFDVSTNDLSLPFNIPNYQVQQYGGCTFMTAPVVTLSANKIREAIKTEKRNLWEKLKIIFSI